MANTFSKYCIEYINNQETVESIYGSSLLTVDLIKPLESHKGKTISYDKVTLNSKVMGTYNRATGYGTKDFTSTRVEKTLSKDNGDSLMIDIMDRDEAQIEGSTVRLYNKYMREVAMPTVDKHSLAQVGAYDSATEAVHANVDATNIIAALLSDKAKISNKRINFKNCIIYMSVTCKGYLDTASIGKGYLELGNWNGNLDANVEMFKGAKIVEVPDDYFPEDVQWIIVHPLVVDEFIVYQEAEFFDRIPGFGGRKAEVDVGVYFDTFVNDNGKDGVVVSVSATRA